jgi:hypothetical protein
MADPYISRSDLAVAPDVRFSGGPAAAFLAPANTPQAQEAGGQVLRSVQGAAVQYQQQANTARTQKAYADLSTYGNDLLYGRAGEEGRPSEVGALMLKGTNALAARSDYLKKMQEKIAQINGELANNDQREIFAKIAQQEFGNLDGALARHVGQEAQGLLKDSAESALKAASNDVVLNYRDPARRAKSLELQKGLARQYAAYLGLSHETLGGEAQSPADLFVQSSVGSTHVSVISRMLAGGNDMGAKDYYQQLPKDAMTGDQRITVERSLDTGSRLGEAQRQSDRIFEAHRHDRKSALEAARQIGDPQLRAATLSELKVRYSEYEQDKAADHERVLNLAQNYVLQGQMVPAPLLAQLSATEQLGLRKFREDVAKGFEPEPNGATFNDLMVQASNPGSQDAFLRTNLSDPQILNNVSRSEWQKLSTLQSTMRKKDGKDKYLPDLAQFRSVYGVTSDALDKLGYKPNAPEAADFRRNMDAEVEALRHRLGREPGPPELRELADRLSVRVATAADMPEEARLEVGAALRSLGLPADEQSVLDAWRAKHMWSDRGR